MIIFICHHPRAPNTNNTKNHLSPLSCLPKSLTIDCLAIESENELRLELTCDTFSINCKMIIAKL